MNGLARDGADLYRALGERGLVVGAAGNVSLRTNRGMVITPSGLVSHEIIPQMMQTMGLDGTHDGAQDSTLAPSSEWAMHAAIYQQDPAARVIVHTHSDAATALACLGRPLPAFHYEVLSFGGPDIRLAPYATFGTPELAALAAAAIRGRTACLLANHGMVCHAPSPALALQAVLRLEALCRQYLLALSAGTPRLLTDDEITAAQARYKTYGQQPDTKPRGNS
jgi:L-fuculose-phosphate aldolase